MSWGRGASREIRAAGPPEDDVVIRGIAWASRPRDPCSLALLLTRGWSGGHDKGLHSPRDCQMARRVRSTLPGMLSARILPTLSSPTGPSTTLRAADGGQEERARRWASPWKCERGVTARERALRACRSGIARGRKRCGKSISEGCVCRLGRTAGSTVPLRGRGRYRRKSPRARLEGRGGCRKSGARRTGTERDRAWRSETQVGPRECRPPFWVRGGYSVFLAEASGRPWHPPSEWSLSLFLSLFLIHPLPLRWDGVFPAGRRERVVFRGGIGVATSLARGSAGSSCRPGVSLVGKVLGRSRRRGTEAIFMHCMPGGAALPLETGLPRRFRSNSSSACHPEGPYFRGWKACIPPSGGIGILRAGA